MATWSKAELAAAVLERLGAKAAGQPASAEDQVKTEAAIDSVHAELRRLNKAPFALATIPEWAQLALEEYMAGRLSGVFGITGQRRIEVENDAARGWQTLCAQTSAGRPRAPIRARHF